MDNGQIDSYTVIDLEMTGLQVKKDKIIEIGAVRVRGGKVSDTYATLLQCDLPLSETIMELTGITQEMLADGMPEDEGMQGLLDFMQDDILVGQNFSFDYGFIRQWAVNHKKNVNNPFLDTLKLARALLPPGEKKNLESLCRYFQIEREQAHRALADALETQRVFEALCRLGADRPELFVPKPMNLKVKKISPITKSQIEQIKKYRALHQVTEPICWEALNRGEATRLMEHYYKTYGRP